MVTSPGSEWYVCQHALLYTQSSSSTIIQQSLHRLQKARHSKPKGEMQV